MDVFKQADSIFQQHGNMLYAIFLKATKNHHDAEDLMSEFKINVVNGLINYKDQGKMEQWVKSIAYNLIRNKYRNEKTNPKPITLDEFPDIADKIERPDEIVHKKELYLQVRKAVFSLPTSARRAILIGYFGDDSKPHSQSMRCASHRGLLELRHKLRKI